MIQRKYYKTVRVIVDSDGGGTPFYIENVDTVPGYFTLKTYGSPTYTPNLNYRIDNGEWFEYDVVNRPRIEVPVGSKIYLKGNNTNGFNQNSSGNYMFQFYSSKTTTNTYCKYNIGGYITSLLALDNFHLINHIPDYSFINLFKDDSSGQKMLLISVESLITSNITSVGQYSFSSCFYCCKNLVTAPTFENVTSVGKEGFNTCFLACTSLVTAPTFDKIIIGEAGSFDSCFSGCTSLVTAPTFENVTSVETDCFRGCFQICTSLVTTPNFINITSVGAFAFNSCFNSCTSLRNIIAPSPSTWNTQFFVDWVNGIPSTGTFYKKKGLEIPTGVNGIPEGWTVVEED